MSYGYPTEILKTEQTKPKEKPKYIGNRKQRRKMIATANRIERYLGRETNSSKEVELVLEKINR